jgi:hypothetical protein
MAFDGLIDAALHVRGLGEINGLGTVHAKAGRLRRGYGCRCSIGIDITPKNPRSLAGKQQYAATPDAGADTGHQRDFPSQSIAHFNLDAALGV